MSSVQNSTPSISSLKALLPDVSSCSIDVLVSKQVDEQEDIKLQQEKKLTKEQSKLKERIQNVEKDLLVATSTLKALTKNQNESSSSNGNMKKKMKALKSQNTSLENRSSKQDNRIRNIDLEQKRLNEQLKELKKKCNDFKGNDIDNVVINVVKSELKKLEDDVVGIYKTTNDEVKRTNTRLDSLEKTVNEMNLNMLSILDHCGSSNTTTENSSFFLQLVKEQLALLTNDVTTAYTNCIDKIEKVNIADQLKIKELEKTVKEKAKMNVKLEKRINRLENETDIDTKQIRSNQRSVTKLQKSLEEEKRNNDELEQRVFELESMFEGLYISTTDPGNGQPASTGSNHNQEASKKEIDQTSKTDSKKRQAQQQASQQTNAKKIKSTKTVETTRKKISAKDTKKNLSMSSSNTKGSVQKSTSIVVPHVAAPSSYTNGEDMSYFQKAQLYLFSQLESSLKDVQKDIPNISATILDEKNVVKEPILRQYPIEWTIRKQRDSNSVHSLQHGNIFYTASPGYRMQFRGEIDQLHGDMYFSVRILRGVFDDKLQWPFTGGFKIQVKNKSSKKSQPVQEWKIPANGSWKSNMRKASGKKDRVYSEWVGPFDVSRLMQKDTFHLLIDLA